MSEPIHIGWETATEKSFALDCFHDGTEHKFDNETKYKIVAHKYKEITDADDEAQGLRDWEWYIEVFKKMSEPKEYTQDLGSLIVNEQDVKEIEEDWDAWILKQAKDGCIEADGLFDEDGERV